MRGLTQQGSVLTVTDPFELLQSKYQPFPLYYLNSKSERHRMYDHISCGHARIEAGLQYDLATSKFLNAQPIRKLVPIPEVHNIYKEKCRKLRARMRALFNLGAFKLDQQTTTDLSSDKALELAFADPNVENMTNVVGSVKGYFYNRNPYELFDRYLSKAINTYRDSWLEQHNGFTTEEDIT